MRIFTVWLLAALLCAGLAAPQAAAQVLLPPTQPAGAQPTNAPPPDYGAIADLLENEASRTRLIEELRRLSEGEEVVPPAAEELSITRQVANFTNAFAENFVREIGDAYDRLAALELGDISASGLGALGQAVVELGALVAGVVVVLWLLRRLAGILYRRASDWVVRPRGADETRPWLRRIAAAIGCSTVDLGIVALGWVAGYLIALFVVGEGGRMQTRQALFLNAFLIIETVKVFIRLFFATRYDGLRLLPIGGEDAAYWYTWLSRITGWVGYGLLVAVPIVSFNLGASAGSILAVLVHALALLMVVIIVRQNRVPVRDWFQAMGRRSSIGFARMLLATLAQIWQYIAIGYFAVLSLMLLIRPETAMSYMVAATVQTLVALAAGMALSALIERAIRFGIRLKPEMRSQFPMLEERLNAFIPTTMKVARIAIAIVVAALVLDAWSVFDLVQWISSDRGLDFIGTLVTISIILGVSFGLWLLVSSWIERRLNPGPEGLADPSRARERTLLTIFRNAFTIALAVMVLMITLSELGLDIGPLLAGAGVLGLAIGFGSQKLVQDVINGVFIQLENAIYTGDVVTVGGITGVVEKLTVRSVGLRDLSGTYHIVPFSSVDTVSNFMRGFSYHVGEYGVAYRENVDEVIEVLRQAFDELRRDPEHAVHMIGDLDVQGITAFADSSVIVRVRIKTLPGQQWGVGRAYNAIVKKRFDAAGIEIPYPHMTLYFGEDRKGSAPAAPIRFVDADMSETAPDAAQSAPDAPPRPRRAARRRKPAEKPEPDIPSDDEI